VLAVSLVGARIGAVVVSRKAPAIADLLKPSEVDYREVLHR
jgi:hypothetical protein